MVESTILEESRVFMNFIIIAKQANLGLRFILEMATIAALVYYGFNIEKGLMIKLGVGIGLPLLVIVVWGAFGSPKAPFRLNTTYRFILELTLYSLALVALLFTKHYNLALLFGILTLINIILIYVWDQ